MRSENKCVASWFLSVALMAPIGALAMPAPQDERDHDRHEQEERSRVYDPDHRDYHNWDQREDEAYRHWLEERREAYRQYVQLNSREQREYWKWRHKHAEHEEHEEHEHEQQ